MGQVSGVQKDCKRSDLSFLASVPPALLADAPALASFTVRYPCGLLWVLPCHEGFALV